MLALSYTDGIRTYVDGFTVEEFLLYIRFASRVVFCNRTDVFCVHVKIKEHTEVTYFQNLPVETVDKFYTVVSSPYSRIAKKGQEKGQVIVGDDDDENLFVDYAQVVFDNFSERCRL